MPRDFQRAKVYAAEHASPDGPAFFSLFGMQTFVDRITRTRFWRKRAALRYWSITCALYIPAKAESLDIWADRRQSKIWIARSKKSDAPIPVSEEELIHELSHFIATPGHGPDFVRALLDMTRRFHSMPTRARALSERLVDNGVVVKPAYRGAVAGTVKRHRRTTSKKTRK
jgi:hypothetical protein